MGSLVSAGG